MRLKNYPSVCYIDQQYDNPLQMVFFSIKQHTEEKIATTVKKQKTLHGFWKS